MYCSTCGNRIAEHLNYCNSCGARTEKNPLIIRNSSSSYIGKALVIVGGFGFIGFLAVLKMLLEAGTRLDIAAIVIILIAYLVTLFLIMAMMIGHIWKNSGDIRIKQHEPNASDDYVSPASFRAVNTAQLESAREPASVTEHTTRTLDHVSVDRS
ncbi:MAG TPA: hypothetical protein VGQ55_12570 [Pyrinomonadaceae bacterium]|nr:hypothetical protein [Pyrinomonadaceae bacterium]